jgi:IS605 OrfB family transposase
MCKLDPDRAQAGSLGRSMHKFNAACSRIAETAFALRCANKRRLQKIVYRGIREEFGLSSQMAIRAIAKTCAAYKRDKDIVPKFRPDGAVPYDQRILSWRGTESVSILTLDGRIVVPVKMGHWQRENFRNVRGQAQLISKRGRFYLTVMTENPEPKPYAPTAALGVDLGIVNLAVDSDGTSYSGTRVDAVRTRMDRLKADLQSAGTRSAKRHLKRLSGREARFRRDVNHCISKELVVRAKDTRRIIALEDLKGIRAGTTVHRSQRRRHSSWGFYQLRSFVEYKAKLAGVPTVAVPPRGTSHECPGCGHEEKANRKNRNEFECRVCGLAGPADYIAAVNIAVRANVNAPIVASGFLAGHPAPQLQASQ